MQISEEPTFICLKQHCKVLKMQAVLQKEQTEIKVLSLRPLTLSRRKRLL